MEGDPFPSHQIYMLKTNQNQIHGLLIFDIQILL